MFFSLRWRFGLPLTVSLAVLCAVAWLFARELLTPPAIAAAERALLREAGLAGLHLDDALAEVARRTDDLAALVAASPNEDPLPLLAAAGLAHPLVASRAVFLAPGGEGAPEIRYLRDEALAAEAQSVEGASAEAESADAPSAGTAPPPVDEEALGRLAERVLATSRELGVGYWSRPVTGDPLADTPLARRVSPVRRDGAVVGGVTAGVALARLQALASAAVPEARFTVLDAEGSFVSHRQEAWILERSLLDLARELGWGELADLDALLPVAQPTVVRMARFEDQAPHWIAFVPLTTTGWTAAMAVPEQRMLGALTTQLRQLALVLGVLVLAAGALLVLASGRLLAPVRGLSRAVSEMLASGGAGAPSGRDELDRLVTGVGELGQRLDAGAKALARTSAERDREARRAAALEAEGSARAAGEQAEARTLAERARELETALQERDAALRRAREAEASGARRLERLEAEHGAAAARLEGLQATFADLWRDTRAWGLAGPGFVAATRFPCPGADAPAWCDAWSVAGGERLVVLGHSRESRADALPRAAFFRLALARLAGDGPDAGELLRGAQRAWRQQGGRVEEVDLFVVRVGAGRAAYASAGRQAPYTVDAAGAVVATRDRFAPRPGGWITGSVHPGETLLVRTRGAEAGADDEAVAILLTTHGALELEALADLVADLVVEEAGGAEGSGKETREQPCEAVLLLRVTPDPGTGEASRGGLGRFGDVLRRAPGRGRGREGEGP